MKSDSTFGFVLLLPLLRVDGSFDKEDVDFAETWKAMEALVDAGLVKHIGK